MLMAAHWIPCFQVWFNSSCFKNEELQCYFDLDIFLGCFEGLISRVLLAKMRLFRNAM